MLKTLKTAKATKVIPLVCALVLGACALPLENGTSTAGALPTHVILVFGDGSKAEEKVSCLADFTWIQTQLQQAPIAEDLANSAKRTGVLTLPEIKSQAEFARFKALWTKGKSISSNLVGRTISGACDWLKKQWGGEKDLSPDEFIHFFAVAECLHLEGNTLRCFAKNMLRRGLFGEDSAGTVISSPHSHGCLGGQTIAWQMLLVFAEQLGLRVRTSGEKVVFYPAASEHTRTFELTNPSFKIIRGVEDIAQVNKAVLVGRVPPDSGKNPTDHAAVFGWLLCHAQLSSLSVRLGVEPGRFWAEETPPAGLLSSLNKDLAAITQPCGQMQVVVDGLDLSSYRLDCKTVRGITQEYPDLKEVKMDVKEKLDQEAIDSLGAIAALKTVCILGVFQETSLVAQLAVRLPNLKKLKICLEGHAEGNAVDFSGCSLLEVLEIGGRPQTSSFVQQLLEHVPEARRLKISARELTEGAAASFSKCAKLKGLEIHGERQSGAFIQHLLEKVPKIKQLSIRAERLAGTAAASFAKCPKLEKLVIEGIQSSAFAQHLPANILAATHLKVRVEVLNRSVGASLSECAEIRELVLSGKTMSGFFEAMLQGTLLESLRALWIQKLLDSQECGVEDNKAIAAAKAKGICIRGY